jgi:hypothetical protein
LVSGEREPIAIACAILGVDDHGAVAHPIGADRGVFSDVWHVRFGSDPGVPSVVVKMPRPGPNGEVARRTGAYERERIYYGSLWNPSLPAPRCHGIAETAAGPAFVLEDLTRCRLVDQMVGLDDADTELVVEALVECHDGLDLARAHKHHVRSNTASAFTGAALTTGVGRLGAHRRPPFARLLERRDSLIEECAGFSGQVLCHGDPRADNVAFRVGVSGVSKAVLFDWQQIAIQVGEADLAWLLATSMSPEQRRRVERRVVTMYADAMDRAVEESWLRYRTALVLPGLAVLLLVQRRASGRLAELVDLSVERIGAAVADHLGGPLR